jgi:hypothetical protein
VGSFQKPQGHGFSQGRSDLFAAKSSFQSGMNENGPKEKSGSKKLTA